MSANGEAPFFNAPELTQRDGTLSAASGETFADPVSGLVTAAPEPGVAVPNGHEPAALPVAGPVRTFPGVREAEAVLRSGAVDVLIGSAVDAAWLRSVRDRGPTGGLGLRH